MRPVSTAAPRVSKFTLEISDRVLQGESPLHFRSKF